MYTMLLQALAVDSVLTHTHTPHAHTQKAVQDWKGKTSYAGKDEDCQDSTLASKLQISESEGFCI